MQTGRGLHSYLTCDMPHALRSLVLGGVAALAVGGIVIAGAGGTTQPSRVVAGVLLSPSAESGVRGTAFFRQEGERLSGWVAVWGLPANSAHAVHFHGPSASCAKAGPAVAAHADLVADANGVAFTTFRTRSELQVLRRGFYYNVHAKGAAEGSSPDISCANIVPSAVSR
jgi:hypothetical protein